jgi:hypothetical protein
MAQVRSVRREGPKYPHASEHHKRLSYQSLRELARQRGYKPGWVRYRMRALYGGEW